MVELLRDTGKRADKGKNQIWECRCSVCGRVFETRKSDAKKMKSCNCLLRRKGRTSWIRDYRGQRIHCLEVIDCIGTENGFSLWNVKCHLCGEIKVKSSALLCKKPFSCGCYNPGPPCLRFQGERINFLEIIGVNGRTKDGRQRLYHVLCHRCGGISNKPAGCLSQNPQSCGCLVSDRMRELSLRKYLSVSSWKGDYDGVDLPNDGSGVSHQGFEPKGDEALGRGRLDSQGGPR